MVTDYIRAICKRSDLTDAFIYRELQDHINEYNEALIVSEVKRLWLKYSDAKIEDLCISAIKFLEDVSEGVYNLDDYSIQIKEIWTRGEYH